MGRSVDSRDPQLLLVNRRSLEGVKIECVDLVATCTATAGFEIKSQQKTYKINSPALASHEAKEIGDVCAQARH